MFRSELKISYIHRHLHLELVHHHIRCGIGVRVLVHHLVQHFTVYHHLIHSILEHLQVLSHVLYVGLLRVVKEVHYLVERSHHHLGGVATFDSCHKVVHLHRHPLHVHC